MVVVLTAISMMLCSRAAKPFESVSHPLGPSYQPWMLATQPTYELQPPRLLTVCRQGIKAQTYQGHCSEPHWERTLLKSRPWVPNPGLSTPDTCLHPVHSGLHYHKSGMSLPDAIGGQTHPETEGPVFSQVLVAISKLGMDFFLDPPDLPR